MEINATLFIQAINFFIAYWLLRHFLFSPALMTYKQEQQADQTLRTAEQKLQTTVAQKQHEKNYEWREAQQHFATLAPEITEQPLYIIDVPDIDVPTLMTHKEIERTTHDMKDAIIKGVVHEY